MEFYHPSSHVFAIRLNGQPILVHTPDQPLFHVGTCQSSYDTRLGHFVIKHEIKSKTCLQVQSIEQTDSPQIYRISLVNDDQSYNVRLQLCIQSDCVQIEFPSTSTSDYIRSVIEGDQPLECCSRERSNDETNLWFALEALPFDKESVRGSGLQFAPGDLRQKTLPIWVSEWYHDQLHADDKTRSYPVIADHTTYHPQPTFVSSRGYTFCAFGSAYAQFDFTSEHSHRFHFAAIPYRLEFRLAGIPSIFQPLYPSLPDWLHNGVILGMQGGTDIIERKLHVMNECNTRIAGIWAQDWCGKRVTSFGKRVFWNWQWNENWYPNLKTKIVEWQRDYAGCRFLTYINPYVAIDGSLFQEVKEKDYFVKRLDANETVLEIDFGEFNGAIVDLTNPRAFEWYKNVIRTNLIDVGISGWMADFGEYLPCDIRVHANIPGVLVHNLWPVLWARCNYEAIRDAGKLNEIIFFMRSGYLGVQRYCSLFWTGDQLVSFDRNIGLAAGIRSLLSLSLSNVLSVHTDIGGYFGKTIGRTRDVLLRWCEMATFNVIVRTHEGNRPDSNVQFDSDPICRQFIARMSRIQAHLKPYTCQVVHEAYEQRRSCLIPHKELQFFFGHDLLIAPVVNGDVEKWTVSIPDGKWIHVWTNKIFDQGEWEVDAPLGQPPVFYRSTSVWKVLFEHLPHL